MKQTYLLSGVLTAAMLVAAAGAGAQAPVTDNRGLDQRVKRLERLLSSGSLLKLVEEVESLGNELRELRGELEVQTHAVNQLKQRQRELYLDVDKRLQALEAAQLAPIAPPDSTTSASAPAAPVTGTTPPATGTPPQPAGTETAASPPDTSTPASDVDPFKEQEAYQNAFSMLKSGRYERAAESFQKFLADYPGGKYADNARYWLGETFYVTRKFEPAMTEFQTLVKTHPKSQKLTHAMLKIGYIHDELGQKADARKVLDDLVARFPSSTAAGLARKRLQRLQGQ